MINELNSKCYAMINENSQINKDDQTNVLFKQEVEKTEQKMIYIHQEGMRRKLNLEETQFHKKNIDRQMYEGVEYISKVKIAELDNKIVRLDQLANF